MKSVIIAFATMLIIGLAFVGISSYAAAHSLPPCNDGTSAVADKENGATGRNYAEHHIAFLAKQGLLGSDQAQAAMQGQGHSPGAVHQGFSACDPSGE